MENANQDQFKNAPTASPPVVTTSEPKGGMKWWKRMLIALVVILLILGLTFYYLPAILSIVFAGDAVKSDDANLQLQKVSVADADNGFFDLSKITTESLIIPNIGDKKMDLEYVDYTKAIQWDQSLVDKVLNDNKEALRLFDVAATKNYIQVPQYADPAKVRLNTELPSLNSWRSTARIQAIKAVSLSFQNKPNEALQEAAKLNKIGHNLIKGNNSLIGALVGIAIQQLGSQTILRILPYNNPSKQVLAAVQSILRNNNDNLEGYKNALRFEYVSISDQIENTTNSELRAEMQQMIADGELNPKFVKYIKYGYYYKPIQTENMYINLQNSQVSAIGVQCQLREVAQQLDANVKSIENQIDSWKIVFTENAIGKIVFSVIGVSLGSYVNRGCLNDFISSVAETQLALRQYKTDAGVLPNTLKELVPKYLASIPQDPYDHKPIRYSVTKKILYSVGENKQDKGGSTGIDWAKMENPTFAIGF